MDGQDGIGGTNGINSLLNVVEEPIGENCYTGSLRVECGLDDNGNGILDSDHPVTADSDQSDLYCDGILNVVIIDGLLLSSGYSFACAIDGSGSIQCW